MIINNAPVNEAILSNVGAVGEFRIRNSAKAFSILSSGLYSNKIRAIVRELSCNAVDSHAAAGKQDTPFDVHLPNKLEPYFSVRDYGTGLSDEQVTSIYTTYFESTKTGSNDFIGALGLGSKSPFSYTDNFTVTAIRDGVRGVYSAFINNEGVPSIAMMHSGPTDEPNGVEIQFAVTEYWDCDKFIQEAKYVYTHFKLRPIIRGVNDFKFTDPVYDDTDIIPGVHHLKNSYSRSFAVMGNISYPIDVPNSPTTLGNLAGLLDQGLVMHFAIGELDFQASREGLSYIPQTIEAIKAKLSALNDKLVAHLTAEADKFENMWDRTQFLSNKFNSNLWRAAVIQYVTDTNFPLLDTKSHGLNYKRFEFNTKTLASKYNINITAFSKSSGYLTCTQLKPTQERNIVSGGYDDIWKVAPASGTYFVVNDTKVGAYTRASYHWRNSKDLPKGIGSFAVYVLQPANSMKPMDTEAFFKEMLNPQESRIIKASTLIVKEREKTASIRSSDVRILKLERDKRGDDFVWHEGGNASMYDATTTYYYIPLSGYTPTNGITDVKFLSRQMVDCGISSIANIVIYGVRKTDIDFIKTQSNWIDLETHLKTVLNSLTPAMLGNLAANKIDSGVTFRYNSKIVDGVTKIDSPYSVLLNKFKGVTKTYHSPRSLDYLLKTFAPTVTTIEAMVNVLKDEIEKVLARYPLLKAIDQYNNNAPAIAEYINLIDEKKGI